MITTCTRTIVIATNSHDAEQRLFHTCAHRDAVPLHAPTCTRTYLVRQLVAEDGDCSAETHRDAAGESRA